MRGEMRGEREEEERKKKSERQRQEINTKCKKKPWEKEAGDKAQQFCVFSFLFSAAGNDSH